MTLIEAEQDTKTLLIFGLNIPEPNSTAAGTRMLQLIHLFQDYDFKVHLACAQPKTEFSFQLKNINVKKHKIGLNDNSTTSLLERIQPDVVMFDRFITEEQFGWMVDEICPHALKILDTEDLHFLRENRANIIKKSLPKYQEFSLTEKAKREIAAIYRCDFSLMISKAEIKILTHHFNLHQDLLFYMPFVFKIEDLKAYRMPTFNDRKHFVSIGNFKHAPNLDMVKHLHQAIWPQIREALPDIEWHIYGAYLPQQIKEWHKPAEGIIVKGRAEEVFATLQHYRVMLAPLRFGAGLKGKCINSMQAGTPSVTTTIGAEGIAQAKYWPGSVEDDMVGFCRASVELYQNQNLWTKKQDLGFKILKEEFDVSSFKSDFKTKMDLGLSNLEGLRQKNNVGEILKHHHHRSTKYMSLWIEEKNKK